MKKAIILSGGKGERLIPVTFEIPKSLITVHKKPILNHLIEFLLKYNIKDIIIIANILDRKDFQFWEKIYKKKFKKIRIKIFYEKKRRGTFGWVNDPIFKKIRKWIGKNQFVLANGDSLIDFDFMAAEKFHHFLNSILTIILVKSHDYHEYFTVVNKNGFIKKIIKAVSKNSIKDYIISGFYIADYKIFNYIEKRKEYLNFENDIIPILIKKNSISAFKAVKSRFFDCGNIKRWERAIKRW